MKKVFAGLFIMMMGLFFVACSGAGDIKGLIEKAKAEGANWTEAQWKDAYKQAMTAAKPMFQDLSDLEKKAQDPSVSDEDKIKLMGELGTVMDKYKDLGAQLQELQKIVEANPTASKVINDLSFQEELQKELGVDLKSF